MPEIALVGNYGAGRIADELIRYALEKEIRDLSPNTDITCLRGDVRKKEISHFDLVIFGGGTLLGQYSFPTKLKCPFSVFGTGIRQRRDNWKEIADETLDSADYWVLRGEYTAQEVSDSLDFDEKLLALGDPIFLLDPPPSKRKRGVGSNIRRIPENEKSHCSSEYYNEIISLLVEYVTDDEEEVEFLNLCEDQNNVSSEEADLLPVGSPEEAINLMDFRFWIGQRLHSSSLALLRNIPTIFLNYQFNKAVDLCSVIDYDFILDFQCNLKRDIDSFRILYERLEKEWDVETLNSRIEEVRKNLRMALTLILEEAL